MTRRQNACASTLLPSSVTSHRPGNMSKTRRATRSPAAPPPVPAQDQELADLARPVPREVRAVADQREARELPVHADQERPPVGVGPEAFDPRLDPVEPVVTDVPAVDRAEVVEIELHEAPEDRCVL